MFPAPSLRGHPAPGVGPDRTWSAADIRKTRDDDTRDVTGRTNRGTTHNAPPVSVIVPARNAPATLPATLDSILVQRYGGPVEIIVAEGSGTCRTRELLRRRYPAVRVIHNREGTIPAALNLALAAAAHDIVLRCDAHSTLPEGYVARAVATLLRTGAANVGGRLHPVGVTFFERAVALATTTRLGTGGARYRLGGCEGPADTVFLGAFRRDALEAAGGWDPALLRNEDYELNWRLREAGEIVWFDPALAAHYRPRDSLAALARQYFDYGRWKRAVLARHPRSWRARQIAPVLFLAGLCVSAAAGAAAGLAAAGALAPALAADSWPGLAAAASVVPAVYVLALVADAASLGLSGRRTEALLLPAVNGAMHLAWAAGFMVGPPAGARGRRRPEAQ